MNKHVKIPFMKRIQFTKDGFEKLKSEFEQLQKERPDAVLDLKKARDMGDLRENGWYKAARQKLSFLDRRLRELQYVQKYAVVVEATEAKTVAIGTLVTISDGKSERTYQIVGGYESNPLEGKMSHISPIGKALIGKKVDETVEVTVPSGVVTYSIKNISL